MRSNLDLYVIMAFCILMFVLMTIFIYDVEITKNLGALIPLLSFICGYVLNESLKEMEKRDK